MPRLARLAPLLWGAALSCSAPPPTVGPGEGSATALLDAPLAELTLPADSRGGHAPASSAPLGPWVPLSATHGWQRWETSLPIRSRSLFFFAPPPGLAVLDAHGAPMPHERDATALAARWSLTRTTITWTAPLGDPPPEARGLRLDWPRAAEREAELSRAWSVAPTDASFALRSAHDGVASREGLLLPAPSTASWDVEVPPAGVLHFEVGLLPPELADGPRSDGARFAVTIDDGGRRTTVYSRALRPAAGFAPAAIDLSGWAGRTVRLQLTTLPGPTDWLDYVFVADPILASRPAHPRRVVMIFVDTLRPDHLGLYGYARPTSPALDAWAEDAVVFDAARSVAPWTLPTARTLFTGREPERYAEAATLAARFRSAGYATALLAGNVYLSSNFDMARDWGFHRVEHKPGARAQVDRALAWLDANAERDAFLVLHFMDPHLPYEEPLAYRRRWAGPPPDALGERFTRPVVLTADLSPTEQTYISDRYDQNVRYVDDQVARLLEHLGADDVVVFLSDHGEEFWEHDAFEHGHALYDEVLRVPLVIRAPGLAPSRIAEPVSLLDVAPTLLALAGIPAEPLDGHDLGPAIRDAPGARAALAQRDLAFGRPLYGPTQWGTVRGHAKYVTEGSRERVFDVQADPGERDELIAAGRVDPAPYRERLGAALDTQAVLGLRLIAEGDDARHDEDVIVWLSRERGFTHAFIGEDPTGQTTAHLWSEPDEVVVTWPRGTLTGREAFIVLATPFDALTDDPARPLTLRGRIGDAAMVEGAPLDGRRPVLGTLHGKATTVRLERAVIPLPRDGALALEGFDAELSEMLRALGYTVGDP